VDCEADDAPKAVWPCKNRSGNKCNTYLNWIHEITW